MTKKKFFVGILVMFSLVVSCDNRSNSISPSMASPIPDAYKETEGQCFAYGEQLKYWLYDTYTSFNGDGNPLRRAAVLYAEKLGWSVDTNFQAISPDYGFPEAVKKMMIAKKADVAITIVENSARLVINEYDAKKGNWFTEIYRLAK